MTNKQKVSFLSQWLFLKDSSDPWIEFHQGQCVGADYDALMLVKSQGYAWTVSHPPDVRTNIHRVECHARWPTKYYIERNHEIVDATDLLIVAPETMEETLRSGTWATYRYAKKVGKPIFVIFPDGSLKEE